MRVLLLAISLGVVSCSGSAAALAEKPLPTNRMREDHAPTPFSEPELRAGCPTGRRIRYRFEADDRPAGFLELTIVEATADGIRMRVERKDASGELLSPPETNDRTWKNFRYDQSFPASSTTITSESCATPAGTFACWLYVVRSIDGDGGKVDRAWFAKELPGPPIAFEGRVNGHLDLRMTMLENTMPKPGEDRAAPVE